MSNKIEQQLGFDLGNALQQLTSLNSNLGNVNQGLVTLKQTISQFNTVGAAGAQTFKNLASGANTLSRALEKLSALTQTTTKNGIGFVPNQVSTAPKVDTTAIATASQSIQSNLAKINSSVANTANNTQQNVGKMTISFNLLSRIVFTQAIIRGLREVSSALSQAAQDAVALDRQLARTAIIDDFGRSVSQLRDNVIDLSNQFNKPVTEVATAQYELLQRGIKSTADQQKILDAALKFSKDVDIDASEGVKLLTGVLEAYHLSADHAGEVSDFLFQTIKDGNVTAAELNNKLGPITATAAELGINFKEVGAALVVMTKQGTGTATALTQLRGIFNTFLKPGPDLQKLLDAKGLSTASIAALGLGGTLKLLRDQTKGNAQDTALLFKNIRALGGVFELTGDNLDAYVEALQNQEKAQAGITDQGFAQVMANSAEQIATAINEAKNAFTKDFGQAIIQIGQQFLDAAGGAKAFGDEVSKIAEALGFLAKAGLSPFLGAVKVGNFFGQLKDDLTGVSANEEKFRVVITKALSDIQAEEARLAAQIKSDQATIDAFNLSFVTGSQAAQQAYTTNVNAIITANKGLVAGVKTGLGRVQSAYDEVGNAAQNLVTRIQAIHDETVNQVRDLNKELDKANIQKFLDNTTDPVTKFGILFKHSTDLLSEGSDKLAHAGLDAQKRAEAISELNLSKEYADQAAELAKGSDNAQLQAQGLALVKRNAEGYRDALTDADRRTQASLPNLTKLADQITGIGPEAAALIKGIEDQIGLIASKKFLTQDQIDDAKQKITDLSKQLVALGGKVSPELLKQLGFSSEKIAQILSQVKIQAVEVPMKAIADTQALKDQLDKFAATYRLKVKVDTGVDLSALPKGNEIVTPKDANDAVKESAENLQKVNEQLERAKSSRSELAKIVDDFAVPLADALKSIPNTVGIPTPGKSFFGFDPQEFFPPDIKQKAQDVFDIFRKLSDPNAVNPTNLKKADDAISALDTALGNLKKSDPTFGAAVEKSLGPFLDSLNRMKDGLLKDGNPLDRILDPAKIELLKTQQQQLKDVLNLTSQAAPDISQQLATGGQALTTGTNDLSQKGVTASSSIAGNLNDAAGAVTDAVAALRLVAGTPITIQLQVQGGGGLPDDGSGGDLVAHFGRPSPFAFGGRGQDRVHALIDPRESVVNARSTQRFFSQIQALNAGRVPVFHGSSQSSGNGDINIESLTVPGGPTNAVSARNLFSELQRLRRRGVIKKQK